jgi:hypothetical protein
MKKRSNILRTGFTPNQAGTGQRRPRSAFSVLGISFFCLVLLTLVLCLATSEGKAYLGNLRTVLSTGENVLMFFAHLLGLLVTMALLGVLAIITALSHPLLKDSSHYDRVLTALRFTLKHDPNAHVRAKAAESLAKLDVEESSLHQEHEEIDALLISTVQGGQSDSSPDVRSKVVEGLGNLELAQHSYHYEHDQLDDFLFEKEP